jgi:hypothetical protein
MLNTPGLHQEEGQWLFVTKEAYTQLKPWWMSIFSFGLLLPQPEKFDVRMVPWPFPQYTPIDEENLDIMGRLWLELKAEFGGNPDYFVMWMSKENDDKDEWYKLSQDKSGEFSKSMEELSQNQPLRLALIFSFVLALIGGIGGAIGTLWALKKYSLKFWKSLEH